MLDVIVDGSGRSTDLLHKRVLNHPRGEEEEEGQGREKVGGIGAGIKHEEK